jgi:DNA-binding transcriptional regulator YiaG
MRDAAVSQTLLGKVALASDDRLAAARHFSDSLVAHRAVGNRWGIALTLEGVAGLSAASHPEQALRLSAAAATLRVAIGRPLPPAEQPLTAGFLTMAQGAVSVGCAARARADGEALSEADGVAAALESAALSARNRPTPHQPLFGAQLRILRARYGLSQEALAGQAGLGVATLKALERDQRRLSHPRTAAASL